MTKAGRREDWAYGWRRRCGKSRGICWCLGHDTVTTLSIGWSVWRSFSCWVHYAPVVRCANEVTDNRAAAVARREAWSGTTAADTKALRRYGRKRDPIPH